MLVWLTRGHAGAAQRLHAINHWRISVVTYMELAQGCRDKAELARLKKGLAARSTEIVPITPAISARAAELIDSLALSHGMRLAVRSSGPRPSSTWTTLITANVKYFGAVEGLDFETFDP